MPTNDITSQRQILNFGLEYGETFAREKAWTGRKEKSAKMENGG